MTTILYVHGFNSAGGGAKAVAITKQFPKYKVLSPTFNYKDFKSVLKQLNSLFLMNKINLVVGTSLGGFFALYYIRSKEEKNTAEKEAQNGDDNHANEA